ncbi:hypothetical protein G7Y89_g304 [Cudoniella acicularis]|uniref:Peroxin/Ferlin domain-containing protein n=1 Tax=Cudoniella acicularis TaxID=354080 RepID=A0A8H4RXF1_9HELO|nr:hypothetical protein G7Y89_g304 [Cudoniella acicularis]
MAAFDTPWMMSSTPSPIRRDDDGGSQASHDPNPPTVASFSPVTLSHAPSANKQRSTILVHQKSPLLIATPPQITRALAYSHPFLLPLNKFVGLLTWTTDDPWESFLLVAAFWAVVLYGDSIMRFAGPVVVVMGLILGIPLTGTHRLSFHPTNGYFGHYPASSYNPINSNSTCYAIMDTPDPPTNSDNYNEEDSLGHRDDILHMAFKTNPSFQNNTLEIGHDTPVPKTSSEKNPELPPRNPSAYQEGALLAATAATKRRPDAPGVKFTFILYENQRRWVGLGWTTSLFAYERAAWTDEHLNAAPAKDEFELPDVEEGTARWRWVEGSKWLVEGAGELDEGGSKASEDTSDGGHGWIYYDNTWQNGRRGVDGWGRYTRRRKWYRDAELVEITPSTEVTPAPTPTRSTSTEPPRISMENARSVPMSITPSLSTPPTNLSSSIPSEAPPDYAEKASIKSFKK